MVFNWIDLTIVAVVGFYIYAGWKDGVVKLTAELAVFLGSILLALKLHAPVGTFFAQKFGSPKNWSDVIGYAVTAAAADLVLAHALGFVLTKIPFHWHLSGWNKILGVILSVIKGLAITAFALLIVMALPLRGSIKTDIQKSVIGSRMGKIAKLYGGQVAESIDKAGITAQRFLTVRPDSNDLIDLNLSGEGCQYKIDPEAEADMLLAVNKERQTAGVGILKSDNAIVKIARDHSLEMFQLGYFSHIDPRGKSVGDRFNDSGVSFHLAGENLAYAPDVNTAMQGLMDSPGHRHNILEPGFGLAGIGVADGGGCGKMFTQDFADRD